MIVHTHRLIGEYLYHMIAKSKHTRSLIEHRKFVYGNVLPDVVSTYRKMSHYYSGNKDIVFGMIEDLISTSYDKSEFSERLGIIMHFLSDYSCVYHAASHLNEREYLKDHMKYEARFHFYCRNKIKKTPYVKLLRFESVSDINQHVMKLNEQYNATTYEINIEADFYNTLQLTFSTAYFILNARKKMTDIS